MVHTSICERKFRKIYFLTVIQRLLFSVLQKKSKDQKVSKIKRNSIYDVNVIAKVNLKELFMSFISLL